MKIPVPQESTIEANDKYKGTDIEHVVRSNHANEWEISR